MKNVFKSILSLMVCCMYAVSFFSFTTFAVEDEASVTAETEGVETERDSSLTSPTGGGTSVLSDDVASSLSSTESSTPEESDPLTEHSYLYKVEFVVNGSTNSIEFDTADESIGGTDNRGAAMDAGGFFDKRYFLGWSTDERYGNDSSLWYSNQPVSDLFVEKSENELKLYPVYIYATDASSVSSGTAYINRDDLVSEFANVESENVKLDKVETSGTTSNRIVELYFDDDKDYYEFTFKSEFELSDKVAHWLYTGNGSTIMTNTQSGEESTSKASKSSDAQYTFTDLNVSLGEEFDVPEEIVLEFNGYYYQPYMVIDSNTREALTIKETGNTKVTDIVDVNYTDDPTNPVVRFTVLNPNKLHQLTVRTILRTNSGIGGKKLQNIPASTIESNNMTLTSITPYKISKEDALTLATLGDSVRVSGVVNGYVKLPSRSFLGINFDLSTVITDIPANPNLYFKFVFNQIQFVTNKYQVLGHSNNDEIYLTNVAHGKSVDSDSLTSDTMPVIEDRFTSDGKTYVFKGWNTSEDGSGETFYSSTDVTQDITVYGQWKQIVNANFSFESVDGSALPANVLNLLTVTNREVEVGSSIDLENFDSAVYDSSRHGQWKFVGWTPNQVVPTDEDVSVVGKWEFIKDAIVSQNTSFQKTLSHVIVSSHPSYKVPSTGVNEGMMALIICTLATMSLGYVLIKK